MALESIGSTSSVAYTDIAKQTVSKEPKPVQQMETPSEPAKKTAPVQDGSAAKSDTKAYDTEKVNQQEDQEEISRKVKSAVDQANDKMKMSRTKCEFSYHEDTKRVSIRVIDEDTEDVIREIPPEETLEMLSKMWELAGLFVDERR